ncbi:MAG: Prephenate/arogenate dehydrogenase [Myxococcaceae bacterium]|nr:Prephenate/arogenate dehydrogenase [Myxococcaceae bacterium]
MKIAILGYGRFGAALGEVIRAAGGQIAAYDPRVELSPSIRAMTPGELVQGAAFVVVAVPVSAMTPALGTIVQHLVPEQLVLDVGSVKVRPIEALNAALGTRIPWVGTHPLFGPVSLSRAERPLRAVVCPNDVHPTAAARARDFYQRLGCVVIEQTAEQHDRLMARTHALAFFVAKGILAVGGGGEIAFAPPSYQAIAHTIELVRSDAGHLFRAIQQENPFAEEARQALLDAMGEIHKDLATYEDEEASTAFAIPNIDIDARLPELKETRAQIDALDHELVTLLARRSQLADRAASAKESIGFGIVDPNREAQLIEARREWARASSLDANAVEEIFRAIIRFSRTMQGRADRTSVPPPSR